MRRVWAIWKRKAPRMALASKQKLTPQPGWRSEKKKSTFTKLRHVCGTRSCYCNCPKMWKFAHLEVRREGRLAKYIEGHRKQGRLHVHSDLVFSTAFYLFINERGESTMDTRIQERNRQLRGEGGRGGGGMDFKILRQAKKTRSLRYSVAHRHVNSRNIGGVSFVTHKNFGYESLMAILMFSVISLGLQSCDIIARITST